VTDVSPSKNGVKNSTFNGASTENAINRGLGCCQTFLSAMLSTQFFISHDRHHDKRCSIENLGLNMHLQKNLTCWGSTLSVITIVKCYICYVKTKVKLIYALSAQSVSRSKSIAIRPATAQFCHPASFRHWRQSGFHETHLKLSIDWEIDQEIRHNCDRTCQVCHSRIQLFLWNWSPESIEIHIATHWVLGLSIHVAGIR
jgi:hypothetical protein